MVKVPEVSTRDLEINVKNSNNIPAELDVAGLQVF